MAKSKVDRFSRKTKHTKKSLQKSGGEKSGESKSLTLHHQQKTRGEMLSKKIFKFFLKMIL